LVTCSDREKVEIDHASGTGTNRSRAIGGQKSENLWAKKRSTYRRHIADGNRKFLGDGKAGRQETLCMCAYQRPGKEEWGGEVFSARGRGWAPPTGKVKKNWAWRQKTAVKNKGGAHREGKGSGGGRRKKGAAKRLSCSQRRKIGLKRTAKKKRVEV